MGELDGYRKSWKTLRVERSGLNLVGRISTSSRYVFDIIRPDLLSLGVLEGVIGKNRKMKYFLLKNG